ncbi:MAG: DUF192 domain-containing protein [Lacibacter sp.]|nr:DUF192 domain-containing protein [Lacibacter sp.]
MQQLSFPFSNKCYFSFAEGRRQYAPIEAEEAITTAEIYQSLNYRTQFQFRKPLVLHFPVADQQTAVWFGYNFDVEVILVNANGTISKTLYMPRWREGDALFVQFFIDCAYAILVPVGFCKKWNIREQQHSAKLTSFAFLQKQKAG